MHWAGVLGLGIFLLAGCKELDSESTLPPQIAAISGESSAGHQPTSLIPSASPGFPPGPATQSFEQIGSGQYSDSSVGRGTSSSPVIVSGNPVVLDFVNVDVRDVVRSVLGDVLKVPYAIDPAVQGNITLQSAQLTPRSAVLSLLERTLQLNGIALLARDGAYQVVPIANAARDAPLANGPSAGFITRLVPLRFVAASEVQHALESITPAGSTIRADPSRNLLIVSGPEQSVDDVLRNIQVFDVDYLKGMSFALLPLQVAQARDVAREVTELLGNNASGPLGGMVRVVALERLNAVLVIAVQPSYLPRVRIWVSRFDRVSSVERRLYVYRVQNGRAADLAAVLRRALGLETTAGAGSTPGASGSGRAGTPSLGEAMPLAAATPLAGAARPAASGSAGLGLTGAQNPLLGDLSNTGTGGSTTASDAFADQTGASDAAGGPTGGKNAMRITADEMNNAVVILASPNDYATVALALQKLDITPLQVMIEATIAEVTLTNQLSLGLQYYVKSGRFQALFANSNVATTSTTLGAQATTFSGFSFVPGLNLAFSSNGGTSAILQLLQQLTTIRVLSSPNLMVLNNQVARLQVGDQVPIATASAVSTFTTGAPLVNTIEYRDTGVILKVTPRVNETGYIQLDIAQEVSQVATTTTSTLDSPTISQRLVTSSVAVADGQTIALAGLISDSREHDKNGIPILQDIPYLGALFGTRTNKLTRTELIALITPHVVRNEAQSRAITDELRAKLPFAAPMLPSRGY